MVSPGDIRNARVLIVDDSAVNVLLLQRIMAGAGYTAVSTTTDPRAVCGLHRDERYDLILLDLLMPEMDGFEVMKGLAEIETEGYVPVLVLTAQPAHKLRALQAGAKDFVSKPFDQVEVLTRIHNMLEVRLLLREARGHAHWLEQYDMLTGLPNRARYREMLARALARPVAQRGTVTVVSVAIDRFDHINDALGRATGDALLRCAGDRLVACVGPMDAVARLEEATFGLIVVTERATPVDLDALALAIREALRAPLNAHGFVVAVTASVGIAEAPERAPDADVLMTFTDRAVRESRTGGGNTARVYEPAMDPKSAQALTLEHALRTALANEEFVLHYQPKLRIDTGDWSGAEALLRWNSPHSGLLPPATFIPALESTGLIVPVGTWVIESACRQIGEWERSGIGSICVSVNVSSRQFLRDDFVAIVTAAIRANDIAPELLEIEITESSLMSRSAAADTTLAELKALGVSISIDDFGTGYSSLAYLKRFPIDTLKIDISFIRDVTTSVEGAAIAKAIIEMARSLKMTVIAEGVETQPQLDWLRQHACDEIQGFLYSRPLCADDLALLRRNHLALAVA